MRRKFLLLAALLALLMAPSLAAASDQDRARAAVMSGQARPLGEILGEIRGDYPGRLLDTHLAQSGGGTWVYRLRILGADGRVVSLTVDAKSARILRVR